MTTEFIDLKENMTVEEALDRVRKIGTKSETIYTCYVLENDRILKGIINIKGTTLVKSQYDGIEADKYYEENTGYKKDGYITKETTEEGYRYGYINTKGKKILENKYNELYRRTPKFCSRL